MKWLRGLAILLGMLIAVSGCGQAGEESVPDAKSGGEQPASLSSPVTEEQLEAESDTLPDDILSVAYGYLPAELDEKFPIYAYDKSEGTQEELDSFLAALSSMKLSDVTEVFAVSLPGDNETTVPLSREQTEKVLLLLQELEPAVLDESANPNTGGGEYYYVRFGEESYRIGYMGIVTVAKEGEERVTVFDGAPCEETFSDLRAVVYEALGFGE